MYNLPFHYSMPNLLYHLILFMYLVWFGRTGVFVHDMLCERGMGTLNSRPSKYLWEWQYKDDNGSSSSGCWFLSSAVLQPPCPNSPPLEKVKKKYMLENFSQGIFIGFTDPWICHFTKILNFLRYDRIFIMAVCMWIVGSA